MFIFFLMLNLVPCLSAYPCKHIVPRDKNLLLVAESGPGLSAPEPVLSLHRKLSNVLHPIGQELT